MQRSDEKLNEPETFRLCSIQETERGKVKAAVITSQDRSKGKTIRRHGAQSIHSTKASDDISLRSARSLCLGRILEGPSFTLKPRQ